jgi:hypothetical protein
VSASGDTVNSGWIDQRQQKPYLILLDWDKRIQIHFTLLQALNSVDDHKDLAWFPKHHNATQTCSQIIQEKPAKKEEAQEEAKEGG